MGRPYLELKVLRPSYAVVHIAMQTHFSDLIDAFLYTKPIILFEEVESITGNMFKK